MLRGIYAPSNFDAHNEDPTVSAAQKLAIIAASPVTVDVTLINGQSYDDDVPVKLPFVYGGQFQIGWGEKMDTVLVSDFSVGDDELYGRGIGTRLLEAGMRYALDTDPKITRAVGAWVRLGMLNTMVRVFGVENITVKSGIHLYGLGTSRAVEEIFDDFPAKEGRSYSVHSVEAVIDPERAANWERPWVRQDII